MDKPSSSIVNASNREDPLWYKDAIIYQLHVKSFFDANNDGVGDFAGLLQKLDYIAELGVDTIWLLPFYPSPRRDDGYDIADYRGIHPDYGTMADMRRLVKAAHARGLRVITELVVNHTSDQHPWFQRARKARPGSAARNFYVWSDDDQKYNETRIIFCDTEKSNWTWDPEAKAYYWHRFYSHQPDLNYDNPQVIKEVLSVMRFWLETGVDGLRLDAVPYLVEREGTNNENLPETHEVLRQIRAELDASFSNRLLLAEANQWPEDAQEYFGQGDECHMSFHFPLMPRMYMAIAREDRFPITDIMRQTPDIPENCQWAIFLRNHDELTLEMVTSSERDYLWEVYATDRRARINLGIRRRLAPLLERDRRRIELMNSLLLSMPGTPVVYYGDEIGMGDNIHLGDRDGVRTPMQWTPDRNGGFSRADPEKMVLPPLTGPLYGFEMINVESQQRDPHSLLNWMRRMLAIRRQHKAFGRGSLKFLYPGNRKILAYLRCLEEKTILCVANLSHATQAVELDLSDYDGKVPVEMLGGTPFPTVGELTYLLTLPPYGFYWFDLSTDAAPPSWHATAPERMSELVTLVLRGRTGYQLTEGARRMLYQDVLPSYLPLRRWFAAKDQKPGSTEVAYITPLPNAHEIYLAEIEVALGNTRQRYALPVGLVWEETPTGLPSQLALARVRRVSQMGILTDAFSLAGFTHAILDNLQRGTDVAINTAEGQQRIRFVAQPGLAALELTAESPIAWPNAEQSNSSLIIDSKAVLKLVRRVAGGGVHPEAEMTRQLTRLGYANTPALLGEVVREDAQGSENTLVLLHAYVPNQGDAWNWTLDYLRRTLDTTELVSDDIENYDDQLQGYITMAGVFGRRLAELHALLAQPSDDAAFAPVNAGAGLVRERAKAVAGMVQRAFEALASHASWKDAETQGIAEQLLARRDEVLARVKTLAEAGRDTLQTRIHGDLHLGQILIAQNDAYLIDFEGEPARTLEERREKSSPLRDVAGMLRSFDYAAAAIADAADTGVSTETDPLATMASQTTTVRQRRDAFLERFRTLTSAAFFNAYLETAQAGSVDWLGPDQGNAALELALLEKAAYEVCYEASNRPAWIGIPLRGLSRVVQRILASPAPDTKS